MRRCECWKKCSEEDGVDWQGQCGEKETCQAAMTWSSTRRWCTGFQAAVNGAQGMHGVGVELAVW